MNKNEIIIAAAIFIIIGLIFGCGHNYSVKSHFIGSTGPVAEAPR